MPAIDRDPPVTKQEDIDHHTKIFCEALQALVA
jgi:hypothetical protein